jgi:hypothetical protein
MLKYMLCGDGNKFKNWTGLNESERGTPINYQRLHQTPQSMKGPIYSGIAFNNDRNAVGSKQYSQISGIIPKKERDVMNVRDIEGATSKIKSQKILDHFYEVTSNMTFMQLVLKND